MGSSATFCVFDFSISTHQLIDKMKAVLVLCVLLVATQAAPQVDKRFLWEDIKHLGDVVADAFNKAWNASKDAFHKVTDATPFDQAVDALMPLIHSGMSVSACVATCTGAAATVPGPALAGTVCTPVCDGALDKLQHLAESG